MQDQFCAHNTTTTTETVQRLNTKMVVINGDLTTQLKQLKVSINKPLKAFMKEKWNQLMKAAGHSLTSTGRLKRPTIAQVCEWLLQSWSAVMSEITAKLFFEKWHQ